MGPEHACSGLSLFALRTSIQTWFGHSNCSFTVNTYVYSSKIPHSLDALYRRRMLFDILTIFPSHKDGGQ